MTKANQILYHCRSCNKDGVPNGGVSFRNLMYNLVRPRSLLFGHSRTVFGLKCPHCGSTRVSSTIKEAGHREPLTNR